MIIKLTHLMKAEHPRFCCRLSSHYNSFGKKVLHPNPINSSDVLEQVILWIDCCCLFHNNVTHSYAHTPSQRGSRRLDEAQQVHTQLVSEPTVYRLLYTLRIGLIKMNVKINDNYNKLMYMVCNYIFHLVNKA